MQHAHIDTETNASERRKVCTKCERELLEAENFYIDHRRNRPHSRCKRCWDEKTREWIVKHPERRREIFVRSSRRTSITKTGMGVAEYERRWVEQSGKCAICEKPETKMNYGKVCRLAVDHDHRTGKALRTKATRSQHLDPKLAPPSKGGGIDPNRPIEVPAGCS